MGAFQWDEFGHLATYLRLPAAGANQPVSVDRGRFTPGELRELPFSAGCDLDAVEHLRQDRIRRWQTPPDTLRKGSVTQ